MPYYDAQQSECILGSCCCEETLLSEASMYITMESTSNRRAISTVVYTAIHQQQIIESPDFMN